MFERSRSALSLPASMVLLASFAAAASAEWAGSVSVDNIVQGATPFISMVTLGNFPLDLASHVTFQIQPRPGTVSAEMRATYSITYLLSHSYADTSLRTVTVPVYGLYPDYANSVRFIVSGPIAFQRIVTAAITTPQWYADGGPQYFDHEVLVPRDPNIKLGYSFFMLKAWSAGGHPVVMDTDGYVRWIGTAGNGNQGSSFADNHFYVGDGSTLWRIGLDGSKTAVSDLGGLGFGDFHHNIDPGRDGLLLELNHDSDVEDHIVEVSYDGAVLRIWDFGQIIRDAMLAGGDDPSAFVRTGDDWFHNNAATYWTTEDQLVLSSRENFVIAVDYDTHAIQWILGDPTKAWYTYPSLAKFALTVPSPGHYPIGQHGISFTRDRHLMLFDNGTPSFNQNPSGDSRGNSQPRRFRIDLTARTATETWTLDRDPPVYSPICSSIYRAPQGTGYLIDYASENWGNVRLLGIDEDDNIAFEYRLAGGGWDRGWNAFPVNIDHLKYHD